MKNLTAPKKKSILMIFMAFLALVIMPAALADYEVESVEYNINITNVLSPGSTQLDPTSAPNQQATNTLYTDTIEYKIQNSTSTPTATHLDPTSAPNQQAIIKLYMQSTEYNIQTSTSTPTATHLDPTSAPNQQATNTLYTLGAEFVINPFVSTPGSSIFDPAGLPSNQMDDQLYVLGMEYTMSITPQIPPNIATDATTSPSDKSRFAHYVRWLMDGDTPPNTTRYFLIYFDDLEDGKMLQPSYSIPLITGPNEFFLVSTHDQGDVTMFKSNGDGTFSTEYVGRFGTRGWGLAINDFNEDGLMDFVSGQYISGTTTYIKFHAQNAGNTFDAPVQVGTINSDWGAMDMATADFNNDNHQDFIVSGNNNNLYLFTGDGAGNFTNTAIPGPGSALRAKDTADFNKDGNMDFAITQSGPGNLYVMLGDGTGNFTTHYIDDIGDDPYQATTTDFDEDTNPDIVSCEGGGGRLWFHKGNGDGTFQAKTQLLTNGTPFDINYHCPGDNYDFDHDGHQDLVFTNYNGEHAYYMPGNGDGTFGAYTDLGAVDRHGNSRALIMGISAPPSNENPALTITVDTIQEFTGGYSIYVTECLGKPTNPPATVYAYQNGELIQTVETDNEGHAFLPVEPGTYDIKACLTIDTVEKCNWKYSVNLNG